MSHSSRHAEGAVEDGKSAVAEAKEAATSMAGEAMHAAHDVADRVKATGAQAADYARQQYDNVSDRARDAYSRTRSAIHDCEETTAGYVKQSPLTAIMIALGLGLLIGLIWRRHDCTRNVPLQCPLENQL